MARGVTEVRQRFAGGSTNHGAAGGEFEKRCHKTFKRDLYFRATGGESFSFMNFVEPLLWFFSDSPPAAPWLVEPPGRFVAPQRNLLRHLSGTSKKNVTPLF